MEWTGTRTRCRRHRAGSIAAVGTVLLLLNVTAFAQWPQWGGANRDFKASSQGLASVWPEDGPPRLFSAPLEPGCSSVVVDGGHLYATQRFGAWEESLIAFDTATWVRDWTFVYPASITDRYDQTFGSGPRVTPLVVGHYVYTVGFTGKMRCVDIVAAGQEFTGLTWTYELFLDFNGTFMKYGHSSSPLAYQDTVIVQIGGKKVGFVALNAVRGDIAWKSPPFVNSYSSPIIINVDGKDQLIAMGAEKVVSVDPSCGKQKWTFPHRNSSRLNVGTPVWGPDNLLFLPSAGEGESRMLKLTSRGSKTDVKEVWASREVGLGTANVVRVGDYLYGASGAEGPSVILAVKAATGEIAWRHEGFANARMTYGDGKFFLLDENGVLALATATPQGLKVHSRAKVAAKPCRGVPALVGTRLYLRDDQTLMAFELKE